MRWFKHLAAARRDERLAAYMDESRNPLEAYGFWFCLLEVVAEHMAPGETKCSATYSLPHWARQLYCHHNLVTTYLGNLGGNGLVIVEYHENTKPKRITVTIPNLLKYRDEYHRKSGQTPTINPEPVRTKKQSKKQRQNIYTPDFEKMWELYPKRSGGNPKPRAFNAWKARLAEHDAETITLGVTRYAKFCEDTGKTGSEYVKQAATFLGPDLHFLEDWTAPQASTATTPQSFDDYKPARRPAGGGK